MCEIGENYINLNSRRKNDRAVDTKTADTYINKFEGKK